MKARPAPARKACLNPVMNSPALIPEWIFSLAAFPTVPAKIVSKIATPSTAPPFLIVIITLDDTPSISGGLLSRISLLTGGMKMPIPAPIRAREDRRNQKALASPRREKRKKEIAMMPVARRHILREPIRSAACPAIGPLIIIIIEGRSRIIPARATDRFLTSSR